MDMLEAIEKRFSCRSYLRRKVSEKQIVTILDAAIRAPNAGNIQNWEFIIVKDDETKEKLTKASMNQRWMMSADVFIVVCSDSNPSDKYYPKRGDFYNAQNCAAAVQNILLTSTELGLGSCWVGAFQDEAVERALKLPEHIKPHAIVTLGYANEDPMKKRRASLDSFVHFGEHGNKSSAKEFLPHLKQELDNLKHSVQKKTIFGRVLKK